MSSFLEAMSSLFTFLFSQLSNVANFFTSNLLGQLILVIFLLTTLVSIILAVIHR